MFDHVDPRLFWAGLTVVWLIVSWVALWLWAKLIDGANPQRRRSFEQRDHVAERRRRTDRNGFKSRIGAR